MPNLIFGEMLGKQRLSKEEALRKIRQYCAYQERCHKEVKEKLFSYGLYNSEVQEILSNLIEDSYLNEERFARQFAGGKFRMKQWGRKKIQYELQKKQVSSYIIKFSLKEIEEDDYVKVLERLLKAKWKSLAGQHYLTKMAKTKSYLLQKGFEADLVTKSINNLISHEKTKK